jgi:hypothetical protein
MSNLLIALGLIVIVCGVILALAAGIVATLSVLMDLFLPKNSQRDAELDEAEEFGK